MDNKNNEMNNTINNLADNENDYSNEKGKKAIVIGLGVAIVIAAAVLSIALIAVVVKGNNNKEPSSENYVLTTNDGKVTTTEEVDWEALLGDGDSKAESTEKEDKTDDNNLKDDSTKNQAVEYYERLSPNGENKLSDHYNNKYIKKISSQYNVDSDLLVAIYSDPDTGNNFVLQFNGERDKDGLVIKSPDTLEKVYHIDKKGKITIATGTEKGNVGVSYGEGMFVFNMIKTIVMEQYPDYFTGLK